MQNAPYRAARHVRGSKPANDRADFSPYEWSDGEGAIPSIPAGSADNDYK
jgi:hypothetical protein